MRCAPTLLLLCATLVVLGCGVHPARAAPSQQECEATYNCDVAGADFQTLLAAQGTCSCCRSTDTSSCTNARRTCGPEHCTTCPVTTTCKACYTGYQLVNGACGTCGVAHCAECMTDANGIVAVCKLCEAGYHWQAGVCTINSADASSSGSDITQCRAAFCKTCASTSATQCETCADGYTFDGSNNCVNACTAAHCDLCYTGSTTDCQLCSAGYTWENGACVAPAGCRVGHCTHCDGEGSGSSNSKVDESTCVTCDANYTPTNGYCVKPKTCTATNCATCPLDPSQCTICKTGFGLVNGVCTPCADPHCNYCDGDANTCTGCADRWYLTRYGTCSAVACNLENCLRCDATNPTRCAECKSPMVPDSATGKCITSGSCSVANCAKCSATSASICETCNTDYTPSADGTSCSLTTTTTTSKAPATTTTTSSAPSTCTVPHCTTCVSGNPNACQFCNDDYYSSNGQCVLAGSCYVGKCAQCMLRDSTKCSNCISGYLISSTYTCISQHVNANGAAAPQSLWVAAAVLLASAVTYLA